MCVLSTFVDEIFFTVGRNNSILIIIKGEFKCNMKGQFAEKVDCLFLLYGEVLSFAQNCVVALCRYVCASPCSMLNMF